MNKKTLLPLIAFTSLLFFASCDKDDKIAKPVIKNLEIGIGDSHIAYIGSDLHVDADIIAEGKIDIIKIEIHPEFDGGEEIEVIYTEFAGLKNTNFHKHIDIPADMLPGEYHFHLVVRDQEGNETKVERDIELVEVVDLEAPVLTITSAPENGKTFTSGEAISISGTITDNVSLAGMLVALVYESDNISDADVTGGNNSVIVMMHTHNFDSPTSHSFTASINVGAEKDNNMVPATIEGDNSWKSGNYYILVKCRDGKANWTVSDRYPIVINL